jgi:hypothetical protein
LRIRSLALISSAFSFCLSSLSCFNSWSCCHLRSFWTSCPILRRSISFCRRA